MPREGWKDSEVSPLTKIFIETIEIQLIMMEVDIGEKLKKRSIA